MKWIKLEDGKPRDGDEVFITGLDHHTKDRWYNHSIYDEEADYFEDAEGYEDYPTPTHYMHVTPPEDMK